MHKLDPHTQQAIEALHQETTYHVERNGYPGEMSIMAIAEMKGRVQQCLDCLDMEFDLLDCDGDEYAREQNLRRAEDPAPDDDEDEDEEDEDVDLSGSSFLELIDRI